MIDVDKVWQKFLYGIFHILFFLIWVGVELKFLLIAFICELKVLFKCGAGIDTR